METRIENWNGYDIRFVNLDDNIAKTEVVSNHL